MTYRRIGTCSGLVDVYIGVRLFRFIPIFPGFVFTPLFVRLGRDFRDFLRLQGISFAL